MPCTFNDHIFNVDWSIAVELRVFLFSNSFMSAEKYLIEKEIIIIY